MSLLGDREGDTEEKPRRRRPARIAVVATAFLALLAAVPLGAALYLEHRLSSNISRIPGVFGGLDHRPRHPTGPAADALDVLLIGTDRRPDVPTADSGAAGWTPGARRGDALMLLHLDADRRGASLISIPRDTWVRVPGHGMDRIDAALSLSGPALAVETVEHLTDVRIDHLAVVDWTGFEALVDAVGGIDVAVPETVGGPAREDTWSPGIHHLDGARALGYVGQRYARAKADLDRVARQQVVLRTLMQESLHQEMRTDPRMLYDFLDIVTRHLSIDDEWSTQELLELIVSMRSLRSADLTYLTMPVAGFGAERGRSVVYADRRTARTLWRAVIADRVDAWEARHRPLVPTYASRRSGPERISPRR